MSFIDDIHTIENVGDLEDHNLTKHIDDLRNLFKKYNVSINNDPFEVINNDKTIRVLLSDIIIDIKQQYADIKFIADHLYIHSLNAKQLSEGKKPYIYQDCNTSTEIFGKMVSQFEENNKKTEDIGYNIEEIEHKLIRMRRLYESILTNVVDYI